MVLITKVGTVISDKMNKTRVVKVEYTIRVPKYEKTIKRFKKYYAHDENNISKVGDVVKIKFTRPISKLKRWEIIEILNNQS